MNITAFTMKRRRDSHTHSSPMEKSDQFSIDKFYYQEISALTEAGGWSVDFKNKTSHFDHQARVILDVPKDYVPTLRSGYTFYAEEHLDRATEFFFGCAEGKPFSTEIKMQTYNGEIFWAIAKGKPLRDESGEIIGIRGVFRKIDEQKKREQQLEQSLKLIEGHNSRLYDFAHIISHNLRSQVSNLQMSSALMDRSTLTEDQIELVNNFEKIGNSLDVTLQHLNKIVSVHNISNTKLEPVVIKDVYDRVVAGLNQDIRASRAVMYTEFSEVEEVMYIEAYLESILQNLITNALRYKHPDRDPEITVFTYEENGKKYLMVRDNGLGIDLEKHGKDLFKLYKTFHGNKNALGLGLFLTHNEVQAMGGDITVESKVDKGSKFIVTLQ